MRTAYLFIMIGSFLTIVACVYLLIGNYKEYKQIKKIRKELEDMK